MLYNDLISIIVPIYNVLPYVDKCISSVLMQTYEQLEIILVDDGSTDGSSSVCDSYVNKDKRIRVIHKTNGGLSDARNVGIESAMGDYILFVDGDDYISPDMCDVLLRNIHENRADIAMCSIYIEQGGDIWQKKLMFPNGTIVERDAILEAWADSDTVDYVIAVNKLYKRELFFTSECIRYPIGRLHEDEFTSYRLLYAANTVVFVEDPLYYYVQRNGSITSTYSERNLNDFADAIREYIPWADRIAPSKRKLMEYMTMRNTLNVIERSYENSSFPNGKAITESLLRYIDREVKNYFLNPYADWKDKLNYMLMKIGVYARIINSYKKTVYAFGEIKRRVVR